MGKLLSCWNSLAKSGCRSELTESECKRISLANRTAVVVGGLILLYPPIYAYFGHPILGVITLLVGCSFLLVPLFHRCTKNRYLGRMTYFGLSYLSISIYSVAIGRDAGIQLFFIPVIAAPFVVLEIKKISVMLFFLAVPLGIFFFLQFYAFDAFTPLDFSAQARRFIYIIVIPSVYLMSFLSTGYFYRINSQSESKLHGMIEDLSRSQAMVEEQKLKLASVSRLSAIGELSGNIAHEINNPLAIIMGYSEQIEKLVQKDNPDKERLLIASKKIITTIQRISKIVLGLRKLSRDGEADPLETADLVDIIDETLTICHESFHQTGIHLQVIKPAYPCMSLCRPLQISQVLLNLIQNAKDAVQNIAEKWVRIEIISQPDCYEICISNSGNPMSPEIVAKLGQPFFTTKPPGTGTGLGLSISRKILAAHDGSIEVDASAPHTTFVIRLPQPDALRAEFQS